MAGLFKSLFGGSGSGSQKHIASVAYNGYTITPSPRQVKNGWSTEGKISRTIGGELKTHHFIRADTTGDLEGAIELTLSKSRMTIDQLGDRIFE